MRPNRSLIKLSPREIGEILARACTLGAAHAGSQIDLTGRQLASLYATQWANYHEKALRQAYLCGREHAEALTARQTEDLAVLFEDLPNKELR